MAMTSWTDVTSNDLAVGQVAKSSHMKGIKNNISAMAEGASGAPRFSPLSRKDSVAKDGEVIVWRADGIYQSADNQPSGRNADWNNPLEYKGYKGRSMGIRIYATGTVRFGFQLLRNYYIHSGVTWVETFGRVLVNGVVRFNYTSGITEAGTYCTDTVSVNYGDVIVIQMRLSDWGIANGFTFGYRISDLKLFCDRQIRISCGWGG